MYGQNHIKNENNNLRNVHFVGLYCVITPCVVHYRIHNEYKHKTTYHSTEWVINKMFYTEIPSSSINGTG